MEIARQIKEPDGGTAVYKMRRYLMEAGFETRRIEADLPVLKRLIDAGVPVIIEEEYSDSSHVAVAIGYDDAREVVEVQDPMTHQVRETEYEDLARIQDLSNHGALIAIPRGDPDWGARLAQADVQECRYISLVDEAWAHLDEGDADAADRLVNASQQLEERYELAWLYRWSRACSTYADDESEDHLAAVRAVAEGAAERWPDAEWPQQLLGRVRLWSDEVEAAAEAFQLATQRDDPDARNWWQLGLCLREMGNLDGAMQCLHRALNRDPAHPRILLDAALVWNRTDRDLDTWVLAEMARERGPEAPAAHHLYADLATARGRDDEALEAYRKLYELAPDHPQAMLDLAKHLFRPHHLEDEALEVLEAARTQHPDHELIAVTLLQMLQDTGRDADAARLAAELLTTEEPPPAAFAVLGAMWAARGHTGEGIAALQCAVRRWPGYAWAHGELAKVLPDPREALDAAAVAVGASNGHPKHRLVLAHALLAAGQPQAAVHQAQQVIEDTDDEVRMGEAGGLSFSLGADPGARLTALAEERESIAPRAAYLRACAVVGSLFHFLDPLLAPFAEDAPDHPLAQTYVAFRTLRRTGSEEARATLYALAADEEPARVLLGWALVERGHLDDAASLLATCPLKSPAIEWRLKALCRLERFDEGEALIEAFLAEGGDRARLGEPNLRFEVAMERGDLAAALTCTRTMSSAWGEDEGDGVVGYGERLTFTVLCRQGDDAEAQRYGESIAGVPDQKASLAKIAVEEGRLALARHFLAGAEGPESDDPEAVWTAARIAELDGDVATAERWLRRGLELEPESTIWKRDLVRVVTLPAGDVDGARRTLDEVIDAFPDDPWAFALRAECALRQGDGAAARRHLDRAWLGAPLERRRRQGDWAALRRALAGDEVALEDGLASPGDRARVAESIARAQGLAPIPPASHPSLAVPPAPGPAAIDVPPRRLEPSAPRIAEPTPAPQPLTPARRFGLACGAILQAVNNVSYVHLGGQPVDASGREWATGILSSGWSVDDADEARGALRWLHEEGHRTEFQIIRQWHADAQGSPLDVDELPFPLEMEKLAFVQGLGAMVVPAGLVAWDYGRLVNVAGWSYLAGYIPEDEAWEWTMRAAGILQAAHGSWPEFGQNYQLGRTFWRNESQLPPFDPRYLALMTSPDSPWLQVSWDTPLS